MSRLFLTIFLTALSVGFSLANTHRVQLSFIVGPPIHVRLIFLLLSTFIGGGLFMFFTLQIIALKKSRRNKAFVTEKIDEKMIVQQ